MPTADDVELLTYIRRIADATSHGLMEWTRANPTTFIWSQRAGGKETARITLQQVVRPEIVRDPNGRPRSVSTRRFVFQVIAPSNSSPILAKTISENEAAGQILMNLFNNISETLARIDLRNALEFLRTVIPTPPPDTK